MSQQLEEVNEAQRAIIRQCWRRTLTVAFWGMVLARGDILTVEEGKVSVYGTDAHDRMVAGLIPDWETSTFQYCAGTLYAILNGRETWA